MTTETILTDERLIEMAANELQEHFDRLPNSIFLFAHAIEQAVLQSPEIQALRRDAGRYHHLRECNSSSLMIIKMQSRGDAPCDQVLVEGDADTAIDDAMEQQI